MMFQRILFWPIFAFAMGFASGGSVIWAQQVEPSGPAQGVVTAAGQLPDWVAYLQALSTPIIALLAAALAFIIGYFQWRTAQQRAVVELFDKRFEVYDGLRRVVNQVMQHGSVTNEQLFEFLRGTLQAKFLFGDEVTNYLDKTMYASLGELQLAATMMETADEDRGKWIDKKYAALRTVANFYQETARLIRPYMSMHAKTPW